MRLLDADRSGLVDIDELFVFLVPPESDASEPAPLPLSPEKQLRSAYQTSPQKRAAAASQLHAHEQDAATDEKGLQRRHEMDAAMMRIGRHLGRCSSSLFVSSFHPSTNIKI